MVRGIADFGSFAAVTERIGCVGIFYIDVCNVADMPVDPRDVAAARMARIDIPGACSRIVVDGIRRQCCVCSLSRPSGPNHIDHGNGF